MPKRKKKQRTTQTKTDALQPIIEYFKTPNTIKQAAKDLGVAYQVVRYRIEQIKSKGVGSDNYDVIEDKQGGLKTIQLKKRSL